MPENDGSSLDLVGWIVAVGTIALVGVTWWYAKTTRNIQEQNRELVRATQAMTRVSAESLVLQTAPLVLVGPGGATWQGDRGKVGVAYKNVGHGPAINTRFEIRISENDSIELAARSTIGIGEDGKHEISLDEEQGRTVNRDLERITYVSEYQDSLGNRYRTVREAFGSISFVRFGSAGEEIGLELTQSSVQRWLAGP